jgi:Phage Tail Collar Domain
MTTPVGSMILSAGDVLPGYLKCDGRMVSREIYKDLFGVIGTRFGHGDERTTFHLPRSFVNSFNQVCYRNEYDSYPDSVKKGLVDGGFGIIDGKEREIWSGEVRSTMWYMIKY